MSRKATDFGVHGYAAEGVALQNLIDKAEHGEEVFFPSSKADNQEYSTDIPLYLRKSITLKGESSRVRLRKTNQFGPLLIIDPVDDDQIFQIENLELVGGETVLWISSSNRPTPQSMFRNLYIHGFSGTGIKVDCPESRIKINNCHIVGGLYGIFASSSSDFTQFSVKSCNIEKSDAVAIRFDRSRNVSNSGSILIDSTFIKDCWVSFSANDSIIISSNNKFINNNFHENNNISGSVIDVDTYSFESINQKPGNIFLSGGKSALNLQDFGATDLQKDRMLITDGLGGWNTIMSSSVGAGGGGGVHAYSHLSGGSDEISAQNLAAKDLNVNNLLITNNNGGWNTISSASFLSETDHESLYSLNHAVVKDSYTEYIYQGSLLFSVVVWTDSNKNQKIRESVLTYSNNDILTSSTTTQFDSVGSSSTSILKTFYYTGEDISFIETTLS